MSQHFSDDVQDMLRDGPAECFCPCHTRKDMLHIVACCEGQCPTCGRRFVRGLEEHKADCRPVQEAADGAT